MAEQLTIPEVLVEHSDNIQKHSSFVWLILQLSAGRDSVREYSAIPLLPSPQN